jgi:CubicO group peptidase (beta-lactamase class C family)
VRLILVAALLALPAAGQAQTTAPAAPAAAPSPTAQQRSLAAGYVALTMCSAIFNAQQFGTERSEASVRANELVGIYSDLDPVVASLEAHITQPRDPNDALNWSVGVAWDLGMPPRVALRQPIGGCQLLPVGQQPHSLDQQQAFVIAYRRTPAAWPAGDEAAYAPVATEADVAFLDATIHGALEDVYGDRTNTTALVIVQDGRIVRERYAEGFGIHTPQRTWSVAKSIAATIIGAAVQRGEVDVTAPAAIANWQQEGDPRQAITLDHLLHMSSGLTSDSAGNRTDGIYFGGVAVDEQAPGWPLIAQPGSTFRYANNDTLLATLAIAPTFAAHPPRAFFDSVSMHSTIAETDWRGNYVLSSQVWATARDLARFGMLYLNDGMWNGTRILPEGWRTYVSTPSGPQPPGDFGYGASFWLMNRSEGVPADTIAAFGNRGQYVVMVPSRSIVIVRRGEDPAGSRFDIAAFTRDVLAALE